MPDSSSTIWRPDTGRVDVIFDSNSVHDLGDRDKISDADWRLLVDLRDQHEVVFAWARDVLTEVFGANFIRKDLTDEYVRIHARGIRRMHALTAAGFVLPEMEWRLRASYYFAAGEPPPPPNEPEGNLQETVDWLSRLTAASQVRCEPCEFNGQPAKKVLLGLPGDGWQQVVPDNRVSFIDTVVEGMLIDLPHISGLPDDDLPAFKHFINQKRPQHWLKEQLELSGEAPVDQFGSAFMAVLGKGLGIPFEIASAVYTGPVSDGVVQGQLMPVLFYAFLRALGQLGTRRADGQQRPSVVRHNDLMDLSIAANLAYAGILVSNDGPMVNKLYGPFLASPGRIMPLKEFLALAAEPEELAAILKGLRSNNP